MAPARTTERLYLTSFTDLGLAEPLLRAIAAEGYTAPTPIQNAVVPAMMSGKDILGTAQTGTGKTAAFVLPLLHRLAAEKGEPAPKTCRTLILAPTRELAAQIADSVRRYGKHLRLRTTLVIGGAKPGPQARALARGVDVLIATPGRLLDHAGTGAVRLNAVTAIVLDEADHMLDLGFMPAIDKIMKQLPAGHQTALLSATMPPAIRSLAARFLNDPERIEVAPVSRPIERIDQSVRHLETGAKRAALTDLLRGGTVERAVVFTRTKRGADKVSRHLEAEGLASAAIHGNKSQGQRERALGAFRSGKTPILVATDIAARGIDIDGVSHVINYELPNVPEAYVHRIGRTARAGHSGVAISLCDTDERGLLRDIERLIGTAIRIDGPAPDPAGKRTDKQAQQRPAAKPASARRRGGKPAGKPGGAKRRSDASSSSAPSSANGRPRRAKPAATRGGETSSNPRQGLERMLGI